MIIGWRARARCRGCGSRRRRTGRIALCRVDARPERVNVGDRLIASANPGHAMKDDGSVAGATILGRAIDPLATGAA